MIRDDSAPAGLHDLEVSDVALVPLDARALSTTAISAAAPVTVAWVPTAPLPGGRKRARGAAVPVGLTLIVTNPSRELSASISVSLPASTVPTRVAGAAGARRAGGEPFSLGVIERLLPRDATPNLPASMGERVQFATLAAGVPPGHRALVCTAAGNADDPAAHPGFVMIVGPDRPHPHPLRWSPGGRVLDAFPLGAQPGGESGGAGGAGGDGGATDATAATAAAAAASSSFLCTQGFGGRGHHRGPNAHHSADFSCADGTGVLAVFDGGIVTHVRDGGFVGGAHVDLLPEANVLRLRSADGAYEAVYLHLAAGSAVVRAGDAVRAGQLLARAGATGFATGAHLHIQVNALHLQVNARGSGGGRRVGDCGGGGGGARPALAASADSAAEGSAACGIPSVATDESGDVRVGADVSDDSDAERETVMWALPDARVPGGAVLPVAGHRYTADGWLPPLDALDALRLRVLAPARGGSTSASVAVAVAGAGAAVAATPAAADAVSQRPPPPPPPAPLADLMRKGLLWLTVEPFAPPPEDALPLAEQSEAQALRAYPSEHTCLVANVVAFLDVLRHGRASRFVARRAIPPVYLSLALNFERDDVTGALGSLEPLGPEGQGLARDEAAAFPAVRDALDPSVRESGDWRAYFLRELLLDALWEVYDANGDFVANVRAPPARLRAGHTFEAVHSLRRATLGGFAAEARASGARAGVVVAFRAGPADAEPFGIWLAWLCGDGELAVADLQNAGVHGALADAVRALGWAEAPRDEVFWAPMRV